MPFIPGELRIAKSTDLRNALLVLPSVEGRPSDPTRVLALEEEGLGLAVLESEDLAVAADVELALNNKYTISKLSFSQRFPSLPTLSSHCFYRLGISTACRQRSWR